MIKINEILHSTCQGNVPHSRETHQLSRIYVSPDVMTASFMLSLNWMICAGRDLNGRITRNRSLMPIWLFNPNLRWIWGRRKSASIRATFLSPCASTMARLDEIETFFLRCGARDQDAAQRFIHARKHRIRCAGCAMNSVMGERGWARLMGLPPDQLCGRRSTPGSKAQTSVAAHPRSRRYRPSYRLQRRFQPPATSRRRLPAGCYAVYWG